MSVRARVTIVWLAAVLIALVYVAARLRVNADFSAFLPATATGEQRFLATELKEGLANRLLLIELGGDTPERLAAVSRTLAQRLATDGGFRYVNNGDPEALRRDFEALRGHRYQLSDAVTAERFTEDGLRAALAAQVQALASGSALFEKSLLPEDPTGETLHLVARLVPATKPRQQYGVWFNQEGTRALLLAQTRAPGSDLNGQAQALGATERAFAIARADTRATLRYSSPGAMAVQSRTLIADDASRLALVSTVLILAILGFVYRSMLVVLLCAAPALTGLIIGVVAVDVAFGGIHAITIGFGATLLGEAVDYPGYLLTQMRPGEPAPAALSRLARTLAMAVLTTAAAAVALLLTGFSGLAQLGLLTMIGVLGAGAVTAWVLPQWIPAGWRPAPLAKSMPAWRFAPSSGARLLLAATAVGAVLAFAAGKPWWDDDLAGMNPLPSELMQRDRELRATLGAPDVRWMLLIDGRTREDVLEIAERLRPALDGAVAADALRGFELVSDYLPSRAAQRDRQAALPDAARLRTSFANAASGLALRIDAFEPFFAAVARARVAPPLEAGDLGGTALGLKVEGLLRHDDERWNLVVPLFGVEDANEVETAVARAALPAVHWIDLKATSRVMMAEFRGRALAAFGVGTLLILIVLVVGLRGALAALRIALPVAIAVVVTAAAMVVLGSRLTVFHLVALMLVAGIGINYALFLARGADGSDPPGTLFRSLAVIAGTTLCAFGTLASSQVPVLRAIGLTVALGVMVSLIFAVLLLPVVRSVSSPVR